LVVAGALEVGGVAGVVAVVAGAHVEEAAGERDRLAGVAAQRPDGPPCVGGRPGGPDDAVVVPDRLVDPVLARGVLDVAADPGAGAGGARAAVGCGGAGGARVGRGRAAPAGARGGRAGGGAWGARRGPAAGGGRRGESPPGSRSRPPRGGARRGPRGGRRAAA